MDDWAYVLRRKSDKLYFGRVDEYHEWVADIELAVHFTKESAEENASGNENWMVYRVPSRREK